MGSAAKLRQDKRQYLGELLPTEEQDPGQNGKKKGDHAASFSS